MIGLLIMFNTLRSLSFAQLLLCLKVELLVPAFALTSFLP